MKPTCIHFPLFLCLSILGCPSGSTDEEHDHSEHNSEAIPESILGLKASGSSFTLEIITAEPDPAHKGKNNWTVRVTDAEQNPVEDAVLTVVPFMTVHGHGTSPSSFIAGAGTTTGEYTFTDLNFIMAGEWDLTFSVSQDNNDAGTTTTDEIELTLVVAN